MVHRTAIEHIVHTIPGAFNNHYASGVAQVRIDGRVPDVIVRRSDGKISQVYEVEAVGKDHLKKKRGLRRILVIALEDGDWEEIQVLTDKGTKISKQVTFEERDLANLQHQIRKAQGRLKRHRKRIGRTLALAREKRRWDFRDSR
jgi:hypothetical protein